VTLIVKAVGRGRSLSSSGSSAPTSRGDLSAGSELNKVLSSLSPLLDVIAAEPLTAAGQKNMLKYALRAGNAAVNKFLSKSPSSSEVQSFPAMARLQPASSYLGTVVAEEVMKPYGGHDNMVQSFEKNLTVNELLGFTKGTFPSCERLASMYTAFRQSLVIGGDFAPLTLAQLVGDVTLLRDFIDMLQTLFGTFLLDVSQLSMIADACASLGKRLDDGQRGTVLSANATKAFVQSFQQFGSAVHGWAAITSSQRPPPLLAHLTDLNGATEAVTLALTLDASRFGVDMSRIFRPHPGIADASVDAYESSKRKPTVSDTSGEHKRGPGVVQTSIQGSSYPSVDKLVFSTDGSTVTWSNSNYDLSALQDSWDAMPCGFAFNNLFTTGLICQVGSGVTLDAYVHRDVSTSQLAAIREWRSLHSALDFC